MPRKQKPRCFNCGYPKNEIKKKKDRSWEKCHECQSEAFTQHQEGITTRIRLVTSFTKEEFRLDYHEMKDSYFTKCNSWFLLPRKGINLDFKEIVDSLLSGKSLSEKYEIEEIWSGK